METSSGTWADEQMDSGTDDDDMSNGDVSDGDVSDGDLSDGDSDEVVAEAIARGRLPVVLPRGVEAARAPRPRPQPQPRRLLPVILPAGLEHLGHAK